MTAVYCLIRGVAHVVDWDQVFRRGHWSETINFWLTRKVTAQFFFLFFFFKGSLANIGLPMSGY